jgi:hypothetical protein
VENLWVFLVRNNVVIVTEDFVLIVHLLLLQR